MPENLMQVFESKHDAFLQEKGIDRVEKELTYVENFIPEFFSKNGEADGIRHMYESIRMQLGDNEKKISCTDIHKASQIYNEYLEGMSEFITEIQNTNASEDTNKDVFATFEKQVNTAIECDKDFIDNALYGKDTKVETVLSEAVQNVEYLIDFIPYIQSVKDKCILMKEKMRDDDSLHAKLLNSTIELLFESVDRFTYATMKEIMNTYNDLKDTLYNEKKDEAFVLI